MRLLLDDDSESGVLVLSIATSTLIRYVNTNQLRQSNQNDIVLWQLEDVNCMCMSAEQWQVFCDSHKPYGLFT